MTVRGSHEYAASIDAVLAMFADRGAIEKKYAQLGHRNVELIECELGDDSLRLESRRVVDVELPGFAKKVLKPTNTMHQKDRWDRQPDGSWTGVLEVSVEGAPVEIAGTMTLASDGARTRHDVVMDVKVKVPIVGGKIADWVARNDAERTLAAEYAFGDEWLASR